MCTVSWRYDPHGYELFFNRDELKSRALAAPPRRLSHPSGMAFLAPVDPQAGGSWLLVNAHGLTLGIVNHYPSPSAEPDAAIRRSRGQLLFDLADAASTAEAQQRLGNTDLSPYAPFHLLAVQPAQATLSTWDGHAQRHLGTGSVCQPVTGSSFATEQVIAARQTTHARLFRDQGDPAAAPTRCHLDFLRQHCAADGAASVLMERPDARTVSFSRIRVTETAATFAYAPRNHAHPVFCPEVVSTLPLRVPVPAGAR
ncbi:MAG: NRDE family protein [Opitutales bacterium]